MEFRLLGSLEVVGEARPVGLPRGRARSLLGLLALHPGEVVATERLIDQLWGETPPPTATTALHGLVSTLRKRLEPERAGGEDPTVLQTRSPGYVLAIGREQVDAHRFRGLVEQASAVPAPERAARLRAALGLWRGPALADFTYEPFAQGAISALEELRLTALEERIDADLALGRHAELVAEVEQLIAEHPFRERLRSHLMLALYRCGRQAAALGVYQDARRVLVGELGIEPGPALVELEQAILGQAPSLELRPPPGPPGTPPGRIAVGPPAEVRAWLPSGRKTVTVVFVDLAESTGTGGGSDPELLGQLVGLCLETATEVLSRHGGSVKGFIGDVVVAVFGIPVAHEDDALRALRASVELRQALASLNDELGRERGTRLVSRIGVNTGEVAVGDPGMEATTASGDAVKVAARLQQAAAEGEVLLGDTTRRLVGDAAVVEPGEPLAAHGHGHATVAWRLVDLALDAPARVLDLDTPLMGRTSELARLRTAFDRTVREQQPVLVTVVGEAGIGKSRLALELAATLGDEARVLTGRCLAYGDGITFWPLREVVLAACGDRGPDGIVDLLAGRDDAGSTAAQVASAIGLAEGPASSDQLFPAVRRMFETMAGRQPLVVVLEDVHWGQPTFLDLVAYLARSAGAALLLLCLARPELPDDRPAWTEDRHGAETLLLEPLGPDDSERLVAARPGGSALPPRTLTRVVEMAQGNPLFLEQLLAALRDDHDLSIPPTVQALLAARLDRLGPAERDLLRCASVAGTDVPTKALDALVPRAARPFVGRHLATLRERDLLGPSSQPVLGEPALAFRHVLIQDAAYRSTARRDRAHLHEGFAHWLEAEARGHALEFEELVGHHLERAHEQRRQLGLDDDHTRQLAVQAGERLANAGLRAYARFDVAAVESLLSRARALLPADHPRRWEVAQPLPEAYQVLGRHGDADRVLAEMLDATADGDGPREIRIRLERARIRLITGQAAGDTDAVRDEVERALKAFEASGDEAGVAQASDVLGLGRLRRGQIREMEEIARRGLAHALQERRPRDEAANRWFVAISLVEGPLPVMECIRECEEVVRTRRGGLHPGVLTELARLYAMREELQRARELMARGRTLFLERVRGRRPLMFTGQRRAAVEVLAGDRGIAEEELRTALGLALEMGEPDQIAQIAADLSRLLPLRATTDEASRLASVSTAHAPADSVAAQALSRVATARVLVDRDPAEAVRLVREAVELVPTVMLNLCADLRVELAEILRATGRQDEAETMGREAVALYERKGNLAGARRARALAP